MEFPTPAHSTGAEFRDGGRRDMAIHVEPENWLAFAPRLWEIAKEESPRWRTHSFTDGGRQARIEVAAKYN